MLDKVLVFEKTYYLIHFKYWPNKISSQTVSLFRQKQWIIDANFLSKFNCLFSRFIISGKRLYIASLNNMMRKWLIKLALVYPSHLNNVVSES